MKTAERIVIVAILLGLTTLGYIGYRAVENNRADLRASVAAGDFQIPDVIQEPQTTDSAVTDTDDTSGQENWRQYYPNTVAVTLGGVPVEASVADTMSTRIQGLSNTPYLPPNVVKLFAFGVAGSHSIWMKDMNYAIDILWVAQDGTIVHIEENVAPETFPSSFASPVPAWFVVETNAGFVATHSIAIGDELVLP